MTKNTTDDLRRQVDRKLEDTQDELREVIKFARRFRRRPGRPSFESNTVWESAQSRPVTVKQQQA